MNPIVFAIVVVVVLGLAGGVILVLASKFMAVYEDPRIAQITECLAGANCGGCGYAGCADYAKAIVENGAPTFKCAPGGDKAADAINTIMGNATDDRPSLRATVICAGGENCGKRFDYQGIQTCAAAASIAGGPSACAYGWAWATAPAPASLTPSTLSTAWPSLTAKSVPAARPALWSARATSSR